MENRKNKFSSTREGISRRNVLELGALGLAAAMLPGAAFAKDKKLKVAAIFATPIEEPWDNQIHVAVAYAVQSFSPVETDGGPPAPVIEMVPMVVTPAVPEQAAMLDAAMPDEAEPVEEAERVAEAEPEKVPEQTEPTAEQPETAPPDEVRPTETAKAEPVDQPPPDEVIPDIVEAVTPEVVVPLPRPKLVEEPREKKPVQAKVKKPAEQPKPRPTKEKAEPARTVATASAQTRPAARTAAPKSAAGFSGVSPAKWESRLAA